MPLEFTSMLNWWQWLIMGSIPPLILALYFLKLRREPVEVSSTYLWRRAIEDMHVNSLWQRLRRNLLLFLQLLIALLLLLACLRPSWQGTTLQGERFVFLIDNSASMTATDVSPTRLEVAKKQIDDMIRTQLKSGDAAMVISFSDRARVEQAFTSNHELVRQRVSRIEPTQYSTDISEALRLAAGLANQGRLSVDARDIRAAEMLPATVYIFSDGGITTTPDFSWGNLKPNFVSLGDESVSNIAVTALGVSENPTRPGELQVVAQVHNFSPESSEARTVTLSLYLDDATGSRLIDAADLEVPAGQSAGAEFTLELIDSGSLRIEIDEPDALMLDNRAYAAINSSRKSKVLLVTAGNSLLERALTTEDAARIAEISKIGPEAMETEGYQKPAADGAYDLIIYDQCSPPTLPRANTLFIGSAPKDTSWSLGDEQPRIQIIDIDISHPLMKYLDFGDVQLIGFGQPVNGPEGKKVLLDSDVGPMCVIAPREGFEDVVLGFGIVRRDADGAEYVNTDWPRRLSFPLFAKNVLEYLGGGGELEATVNVQPGQIVPLRTSDPVTEVVVESPDTTKTRVPRGRENTYAFSRTDSTGIYKVTLPKRDDSPQLFAVNLFDSVESNIAPKKTIETTWNKVSAEAHWEPARHEGWRWLVAIALIVAIVEWYIYNKRVYI
jgi:hypothetical protein